MEVIIEQDFDSKPLYSVTVKDFEFDELKLSDEDMDCIRRYEHSSHMDWLEKYGNLDVYRKTVHFEDRSYTLLKGMIRRYFDLELPSLNIMKFNKNPHKHHVFKAEWC